MSEDSGKSVDDQPAETVSCPIPGQFAQHIPVDRFRSLLALVCEYAWEHDLVTDTIWSSEPLWKMLGFASEAARVAAVGEGDWASHIHPDDVARVQTSIAPAFERPMAFEEQYRLRVDGGSYRWFRSHGLSEADATGRVVRIVGLIRDVHAKRVVELREAARAHTLMLIAQGAPLPEILNAIVRGVESEHPSMICSVLLANPCGTHLVRGAAPSLPAFYNDAVDGVPILADTGSCGTAAYTRKRVVVSDISLDPKWAPFTDLAARANLGSCWSEPILASDGTLLGTFAIYHRTPHTPNEQDIELITSTAHFAAVAIERKRAEQSLRWWTAFFEAQANASDEGVLVVDQHGRSLFQNRRMSEIWQLPPDVASGGNDRRQVAYVTRMLRDPEAFRARVDYLYAHPDESAHEEIELVNGVTLDRYSAPVNGKDGTYYGRIWTFRDISARKATERALTEAACVDMLTGLPNRARLTMRLQEAIDRACANAAASRYAVLFLDFDRFKLVNDTLGHGAGDKLLKEIGRRLCETVEGLAAARQVGPTHTVARLGGDEFVVLLDRLAADDDPRHAAAAMLASLNAPYHVDGHEIVSTASIGIVASESGHTTAADVLRDADTAMYEAKAAGRGRAAMFDDTMRERVRRRVELEAGIRRGIEANEFELHYQPIVSLESGMLESLEALVRWNHPTFGRIPPTEFIPIAEESGLIVELGDHLFAAACRQLAQWRRELGDAAVPSLSVNLSRIQLTLPNLPRRLGRLAAEAGISPSLIHLEVTEGAIMLDVPQAVEALRGLKAIGFRIDVDDFGTGYSSLANLHQFPLDVLKVDRSFVTNMARGREFAALVNAIVMLAHNLGIAVIAEGVETTDQITMLQSLGCGFAQGYAFAKPLPAVDVPAYVRRGPARLLPGLAAA